MLRFFRAMAVIVASVIAFSSSSCVSPRSAGLLEIAPRHRGVPKLIHLLWRRSVVEGRLAWKLRPEEPARPAYDWQRGLLFVASARGTLLCLRATNGRLLWRKKIGSPMLAGPVPAGSMLIAGTSGGSVLGLDSETGEQRWIYKARAEVLAAPAIIPAIKIEDKIRRVVVFSTASDAVHALDADSGKWLWHYRHPTSASGLPIRSRAGVFVHKKSVFAGFSDGVVVRLSAGNGNIIWKRSLAEKKRFVGVTATPVVADGKLFASSYSGSLHALKLKDGATIWKRGMTGATSPDVNDGEVAVADAEGRLFLLNAKDGSKKWGRRYSKKGVFSTPRFKGNKILTSSTSAGLVILDRDTGKVLENASFGKGFTAPPVAHRDRIFGISNGGYVYAFSVNRSHRITNNR